MTTVPGFNLLVQQSGIVREVNQPSSTPNSEPGQSAVQVANEQAKKTTIQESEESERLKTKKEKEKKQYKEKRKHSKKEENDKSKEENDPNSTGRLLDTIV